jgi:enoyl-CoA hydratase
MSDKLLIESHADGVTVLTFNRPQARNALDLDTMQAFAAVVKRLADDARLRAVLITGAGTRAFCSGGDLTQLSQYASAEDGLMMITLMGDALLQLERLPVPVIAAINGYALGGGSEIALACDMRIVDAEVRMGFVQINMALTPGWGAGQRLLRLVGYARALEILLRGHAMHADELLRYGLANRVVEPGTALTQALAFAREIAARPPAVARGIKALLQAGLNQTYETALQAERAIFPPLWAADAHLGAVEHFLQRTKDKTPS